MLKDQMISCDLEVLPNTLTLIVGPGDCGGWSRIPLWGWGGGCRHSARQEIQRYILGLLQSEIWRIELCLPHHEISFPILSVDQHPDAVALNEEMWGYPVHPHISSHFR